MDCQLMKAIRKLEQNEFYAQKKSILIVASFLLHCNLTAKQNTVTSHRPHKKIPALGSNIYSLRVSPQLNQTHVQHPFAALQKTRTRQLLQQPRPRRHSISRAREPRTTQDIPGLLSLLLLLMSVQLPDQYLHK